MKNYYKFLLVNILLVHMDNLASKYVYLNGIFPLISPQLIDESINNGYLGKNMPREIVVMIVAYLYSIMDYGMVLHWKEVDAKDINVGLIKYSIQGPIEIPEQPISWDFLFFKTHMIYVAGLKKNYGKDHQKLMQLIRKKIDTIYIKNCFNQCAENFEEFIYKVEFKKIFFFQFNMIIYFSRRFIAFVSYSNNGTIRSIQIIQNIPDDFNQKSMYELKEIYLSQSKIILQMEDPTEKRMIYLQGLMPEFRNIYTTSFFSQISIITTLLNKLYRHFATQFRKSSDYDSFHRHFLYSSGKYDKKYIARVLKNTKVIITQSIGMILYEKIKKYCSSIF